LNFEGYSTAQSIVGAIGALTVTSFIVKVLSSTYKLFLRGGKDVRKLGKWAVITGATDGIGRAYALALAKKGMSVVLISRTESKLKTVAEEIDNKGYKGVEKTKYVVCDYSKFDEEARSGVNAVIKDLDVGLLINNVGMSYNYPKYFEELTEEEVTNLIEMNVSSVAYMTKMVIGGMAERRRGCVLNIASSAGLYTMPLLAEYSAAKGFVEKFSRGIAGEYAYKNITVQCQAPFYVATKLAKMRQSFTVPTPAQYAKAGLRWIGHKDMVVQPIWTHALMGYVLGSLPASIVDPVVRNMHLDIRKRAMKKEAKKKAEQKVD